MDNKKKKMLIIIIAAIVVVGVIASAVYKSIAEQKRQKAYEESVAKHVESMVGLSDKAAKEFGLSGELIEYKTDPKMINEHDVYVKVDGFANLTPAEMNAFYFYLVRYGDEYNLLPWSFEDDLRAGSLIVKDGSDEFTFTDSHVYKNDDKVASTKHNAYDENGNEKISSGSSNKSGSNNKEKCYWCNGTGSVKYYYGDSDLQAALDGHDASWYGQCGSCGGTGYAD